MADAARDLESKVMGLSSKDRARLAERLIASLESVSEPQAEALWLQEAERRLDELESGGASAVSAEQVFKKSRSAIR